MDEINIYYGSKKGFRKFLTENEIDRRQSTNLFTVISEYNNAVRALHDWKDYDKREVEVLIVENNDFHSFLEHVITSFAEKIDLAHDVEKLYIHNPPNRVLESLESVYDGEIFSIKHEEYFKIEKERLKEIYEVFEDKVIGQKKAKFSVVSSLYQRKRSTKEQPQVLLFSGPSGVGKTELAKTLSNYFGGNLTRIQFSMMQTEEAYKYIFGGAHNKPSLSSDLLARESNIILIDEFDKVNQALYNAFYEMFDEGEFSDLNYTVDVSEVIFILTANFKDEITAVEKMGMPIFSRINRTIQFDTLSDTEIKELMIKNYKSILKDIKIDEKIIIESTTFKDWMIKEATGFKNNRSLINSMEANIYDILTRELLKD